MVEHLDVDPNFAHDSMTAPIDVIKVESTMNGHKKATVEPSPHQFRYLIWHIGVPYADLT